jgi:hypothetical protein
MRFLGLFIVTILMFLNLNCKGTEQKIKETTTVIAKFSNDTILIDGNLTEPIWEESPVYNLSLSKSDINNGDILVYGGELQIVWDDEYLYIGIKYIDDDIAALGERDEMAHYVKGDVCEIFIKPKSQNWYWELYSTPHSKQTTLFFPGGGRLGMP